ncbi:MAG: helix-turn-helix domain-containing protein [Verrucomicrobia bacterium]|nr:helix-turn-helix domain-containing protein [Verrucomicrobiota bacterium]
MNVQELGQRIRARREKCGLKQCDVAAALQVSPQAVSKWERGENAPDIALLPSLCKLVGVSVDWLLGCYGEDRDVFEATVFSSGVQNAREMSESLEPRAFAAWTNSVCHQVTEAVLQHGGVPIKHRGPGLLCFFAGSEHRERAVRSAISAKKASSVPLKIGIATGRIYFGPIGHPDYAQPDIMGEAVSLASLVAGWAAANTTSGIAASALTAAGLTAPFSFGQEEQTQFTGISHPVEVCELES